VLEQAELLGLEVADAGPAVALETDEPFRRLASEEVREFVNAIPLYSLAVAAGSFGDVQAPEPEAWVEPLGRLRPGPGMFVAQVVGESMNRRICNGAWCVFRSPVAGSRDGRILLVQLRDDADPEHGGRYTVKVYRSTKVVDSDGVTARSEILLEPDTEATGFEPIVLSPMEESEVSVVAELIEVLGDLHGPAGGARRSV
jgi:hypothetical protein